MFAGGGDAEHMPTTELTDEDFTDGSIDLITLLQKAELVGTRNEGRRAIEQGGVTLDGEKITDIKFQVKKESILPEGSVLRRGKKKFKKICVG